MIRNRDSQGRIVADLSSEERFWTKVEKTDSCWLWRGTRDKEGYGTFRMLSGNVRAHRMSYQLKTGLVISKELTIDHLCRNRFCVNPEHLEPVTNKVNILRGIGSGAINARKTRCPRGHAYDLFNTLITSNGRRECRACGRIDAARYRIRQGSKAVVEV